MFVLSKIWGLSLTINCNNIDLFDVYENEERKSLAFRLIFQSPEKILTDEEINPIMQKVFKAMEFNSGWEVIK